MLGGPVDINGVQTQAVHPMSQWMSVLRCCQCLVAGEAWEASTNCWGVAKHNLWQCSLLSVPVGQWAPCWLSGASCRVMVRPTSFCWVAD
jgi:hypothetical protein